MRLFRIVTLSFSALVVLIIGAGLIVAPKLGYKVLSVQSGSMSPAIEKGHAVVVTSVPDDSLKIGDVITFKAKDNSSSSITHRIVKINQNDNFTKITTKGDANQIEDKPIDTTNVIGKVNYTVPYIGRFIDFSTSFIGLILLIYIPALYIVVEELILLSKHFENSRVWRLRNRKSRNKSIPLVWFVGVVLVISAAISLPAMAYLSDSAKLQSNTISAIVAGAGNCDNSSNNVSINIFGSSNTDLSVEVDQNATSGDASSNGNTNGGSASSGNATNCSDINIEIN